MSVIKKPKQLLKLVKIIPIPPIIDRFCAKERFVRNTGWKWGFSLDAWWGKKIRIGNVSEDFIESFGDKIEYPTNESHDLYCYELCGASSSRDIVAEFGSEKRLETTLFDMFYIMEKQRKGGRGVIRRGNCLSNTFYTRDLNSVLRDVRIGWMESGGWEGDDYRGWDICVVPIEYPNMWGYSDLVFSRNPALKSSETSVPAQV